MKIHGSQQFLIRILPATLFAVAVMLVQMAGCGGGNPYPPGSYERGQHFVEKENYFEAVEALESFVRHNPTDSLAAEAQFLKAMTTMKMDEFPLAAVEFQILRKDYPTSDRVEEANFQEGVAYFEQVGRVERDITGALDARIHFQNFLVKYPQSSFRTEAEDYLLDISDMVVKKRLRQCKVFRQLHRPAAVVITLDLILAQEKHSRLIDLVLYERAEAAAKVEDSETETAMYRRLLDDFPDSPYADKARSALTAPEISSTTPESDQ